MKIKKIVKWETDDGEEFDTEAKARNHQKALDDEPFSAYRGLWLMPLEKNPLEVELWQYLEDEQGSDAVYSDPSTKVRFNISDLFSELGDEFDGGYYSKKDLVGWVKAIRKLADKLDKSIKKGLTKESWKEKEY